MMSEHPINDPDALQHAIDAVEGLGFVRPPHLTLQRYLVILKEHGLVSDRTAQRFLVAYDEANFTAEGKARPGTTEAADRLLLEATRSVDASPTSFSNLKRVLSATATPEPNRISAGQPKNAEFESAQKPMVKKSSQSPPESPSTTLPGDRETGEASLSPLQFKLGRRMLWALAVFLVTIWTLAAVAVGYGANQSIARSLHYLTTHLLDLPISLGSGDHHLESARRAAADHPNSIGAWRAYADQALRRDRFAEGVVALHRLISLQPDNARTLNELAWLLCTAEEPTVRDPIQALELAEKAHSLDPSPAITDTLAEAAFQNGDPQRAVALEEDAIARLTTGQNHYLRQLEKFRTAHD